MKKKYYMIQVILGLLFLSGCSQAAESNVDVNCEGLKSCELKICNLKNDLQMAKKAENKNRVNGLEISLNKVQKHCTADGLIEELEDKIKDVKKDLQEDKEDYEEALKENRADKMKKYKSKMAEEMQELQELEKELNTLR